MADRYIDFESDPYMSGFGMVAALAAMADPYGVTERRNDGTVGAPPANPNKVIPKGCKEFMIEGERIVALSYKRALKKFQKLKKNKE
jgi:hypothetical protein